MKAIEVSKAKCNSNTIREQCMHERAVTCSTPEAVETDKKVEYCKGGAANGISGGQIIKHLIFLPS